MFETRIERLHKLLEKDLIEALLITSPYNISYLTGIRAFSIEEREAWILVVKGDIYLFTDARYTEMVKKDAPFITLIETSAANPFMKNLLTLLKKHKVTELDFEEEHITYKEASDLEEKINSIELIPSSDLIENLRMVKDKMEIENVRKACKLSDKGYAYIIKQLKAGMTELEVKMLLENYIRSEGGELSFESIVAFGKNAAVPHHLSNETKLTSDQIILLDFGAKVNGYCSDMTRCVFLEKPSEEVEKIYTATLEAQELALEELKGHTHKDFKPSLLQENASSHLRASGFPAIPHGLGHGVGLQVHESPRLSPFSEDVFSPGIVVTVEPGVYLPEIAGVRIEDTVLLTTDGIEILTHAPKQLTTLQ